MDESRLGALLERLRGHSGAAMPARPDAVEASVVAGVGDDRMASSVSSIVVIPMMGEIYPRENVFSYYFGGAVIERMRAQLRKALADDAVKAIIVKIDSPGGMVDGTPEFAQELFEARAQKPIVGLVDAGVAASAAYWLASQMTAVSATPSSRVGSIGTLAVHVEYSRMMEEDGITPTIIRSAPDKVAANEYEPLPESARADLQATVDAMAVRFRADVARGRGVTAKVVKDSFGEGKMFLAADAKALGMIDRIETFDQLVARLSGVKRSGPRADDETPALAAQETNAAAIEDSAAPPTFVPTPVAADTRAADSDRDYLATRVALAKHGRPAR